MYVNGGFHGGVRGLRRDDAIAVILIGEQSLCGDLAGGVDRRNVGVAARPSDGGIRRASGRNRADGLIAALVERNARVAQRNAVDGNRVDANGALSRQVNRDSGRIISIRRCGNNDRCREVALTLTVPVESTETSLALEEVVDLFVRRVIRPNGCAQRVSPVDRRSSDVLSSERLATGTFGFNVDDNGTADWRCAEQIAAGTNRYDRLPNREAFNCVNKAGNGLNCRYRGFVDANNEVGTNGGNEGGGCTGFADLQIQEHQASLINSLPQLLPRHRQSQLRSLQPPYHHLRHHHRLPFS